MQKIITFVLSCKCNHIQFNGNTSLWQTGHIKEFRGINPLDEFKGAGLKGIKPKKEYYINISLNSVKKGYVILS
jgi:hypothetical protein